MQSFHIGKEEPGEPKKTEEPEKTEEEPEEEPKEEPEETKN